MSEQLYEVWRPTSYGPWTREGVYARYWRARLAAWMWDHSMPRRSVLRGAEVRASGDTPDERCPTCGTTEREDRFAMLDRSRAFDAGISGCPDPFHADIPDE